MIAMSDESASSISSEILKNKRFLYRPLRFRKKLHADACCKRTKIFFVAHLTLRIALA
jgi:hypothetical protein